MYERYYKTTLSLIEYIKRNEINIAEEDLTTILDIIKYGYKIGWLAAMNRECHDT